MSKFLTLLVLVTLKTMTKRGTVEIRTWMRTQDPRLAPSAELAAKDDGKIAFSPPQDALQSNPCSQKRGRMMAPSGGRLGAKAPSSQSRRFTRKPLCP